MRFALFSQKPVSQAGGGGPKMPVPVAPRKTATAFEKGGKSGVAGKWGWCLVGELGWGQTGSALRVPVIGVTDFSIYQKALGGFRGFDYLRFLKQSI